MARNNEEHRIQCACVQWFRLAYPNYKGLLYAVPNGGARSVTTAAMLKAEGVLRGVADLALDMPRGPYHGLKVEVKTRIGRQSIYQKDYEAAVVGEGYMYAVVRSLNDFVNVIKAYLGQPKPTNVE